MSRPRVLVIDDNESMRATIKSILGELYQVECLEGSEGALSLATEWRPEVALVDIHLRQAHGLTLATELKDAVPELDLIVMTGHHGYRDAVLQALGEACFYFIEKPFSLVAIRQLVARCLRYKELNHEYRLARRYRTETNDALRLQRGLLPDGATKLPGFQVDHVYLPTFHLGGDLLDFERLDDGSLAVVVADVSGHGFAAAMLTGVVKAAFRGALSRKVDLLEVAGRVSESMKACSHSLYVTMLCMRIDPSTRTIEYINAAHPEGYLWGDRWPPLALESTGPPLGAFALSVPLETRRIDFGRNDRVLLMTDGLFEPRDESGRFFDPEAALRVVGRNLDGGSEMLKALCDSVDAFWGGLPAIDDMALVTVRVLS